MSHDFDLPDSREGALVPVSLDENEPGPNDARTLVERERARARQERLELYLGNLYAENTEAAYRGDWRHWLEWCEENQREPMPASSQDVLDYLLDHAESLKPSTLERRLVTIGKAHKTFGEEPPTRDDRVKQAFKGLIRTHGRRVKRAAPLLARDMRALLEASREHQDRLIGLRDEVLLLVGWFGAFRQSELVAIDLAHLTEESDSEWSILVPRSKTDQGGEGKKKWLTRQARPRYCPIQTIERWREAAGLGEQDQGPLLRGVGRWEDIRQEGLRPQAVTASIRRVAGLAGYEPRAFSGHSLRRGFCVQAAMNGASLDEIMAQTHHRDISTVMKYIEEANARRRNAVRKLELG